MFCGECGNEMPESAEFCPRCGKRVKGEVKGDIPMRKESGHKSIVTGRRGKRKHMVLGIGIILVAACLVVVVCGVIGGILRSEKDAAAGKEYPKGAVSEWIGYEAELANGLRVKTATYYYYDTQDYDTQYTIAYDPEGNTMGFVCSDRSDYDRGLSKSVRSSHDMDVKTSIEGLLWAYDRDDYQMTKWNYIWGPGGNFDSESNVVYIGDTECKFNENGTILSESGIDYEGEKYSHTYSYDSQGRLIEEHYSGETSEHYTTYQYEKDLYLKKIVRGTSSGGLGDVIQYDYEYDSNGNISKVLYYYGNRRETGLELMRIYDYEYDEEGNLVSEATTEGHNYGYESYYESTDMQRYDTAGNLIEWCEYCTVSGEVYITQKVVYKNEYDTDGNLIEVEISELLRPAYYDDDGGKGTWHKESNDTMYSTAKIEFQYDKAWVRKRITRYKYEANADYSIVNLLEVSEGEWNDSPDVYDGEKAWKAWYEVEDDMGFWMITYYTDAEVEQYLHDKEFQPVN